LSLGSDLALLYGSFPVWLPHADTARPGRQLYRVSTTWVSANGASRYTEPPSYVYVTPDRLKFHNASGAQTEFLPGGKTATPCPPSGAQTASSPFSYAALATQWYWSKVNGQGAPAGPASLLPPPRQATIVSSRLIRFGGGCRPSSARAARARRTTVSAAPRRPCSSSAAAARRYLASS
jgi:hypothetical protein